jgi:peptide-methionine (S)-S-oxide reductase
MPSAKPRKASAFRNNVGRVLAAGGLLLCASVSIGAAENAIVVPPPKLDMTSSSASTSRPQPETAVIAGGCFWGVQAVYQHTKGVLQAMSGYSGGDRQTAIYEVVSSGRTGHAEAVQISFDPAEISYGKILQIFFSVAHDPTQLNRQGPDVGPQYRTAIFYANDEQKRVAEAYIRQLDELKLFRRPIVTRLEHMDAFYPAEDYHQDYATLHPGQPYIAYNDLPKIENLKRLMPQIYREKPVLVRSTAASN